jgi:hypothetical protein
VISPGTMRGDLIDVEVELDSKDKATSLRDGILLECELAEYADAYQLRGNSGSHGALKGHNLVRAEGPLMVGLADPNDKDRQRRGRVHNGGRCLVDRGFALVLNKDSKDARTAKIVADRVSERFFGPYRGTVRGMATAMNDQAILLKIPHQYRHNWPRYLRVVRQVPIRDQATQRAQYQQRLAEDLLDPKRTVVSALRLEALGADAAPTLQQGLRHPHPLVRFSSAEALAYLGEPSCAETLAALCEEDPRFRAYALTALASLDESICHVQLRRLMSAPSAETRYGAFRALRTLDDKDPAVAGKFISDSFHLHHVALDATPMIHVSMVGRPEVVLFGEEQLALPPFALQAGPDFVITANEGEDRCIVSRISARSALRKEPCGLAINEIIHKLGEMGAGYADVVDFLQNADRQRCLSCRFVIDALPQSPSVYALARSGASEAEGSEAEDDGESLGTAMTPNLFAKPGKRTKPALK